MKNGFVLLTITILLVAVCGCTQTAPPAQPPATAITPSQTTVQTDGNNYSCTADNYLRI